MYVCLQEKFTVPFFHFEHFFQGGEGEVYQGQI